MYNILVTGGAGFIGSNLVKTLLLDDRVSLVRVLDNLATGFEKNIIEFYSNPKFQFLNGDLRNYADCLKACNNIHLISHQAALGSVPRSIKDPITTNNVNINGTLNIFYAAVESKIKRVVFAASSSTYGDSIELPKVEDRIGRPLSPYAVTKYVNELYADVFSKTYGMEYIGLRYFNIFGPNQDPNGAYAAVIPLFIKAALTNISPVINGDGKNSRDFTFVSNAVEANIKALFSDNEKASNQIYNVACGEQTSLVQLWEHIKELSESNIDCQFGPQRVGDIPHSLANIDKIKKNLNYIGGVKIKKGLMSTLEWGKSNFLS